MITTGQLPAEQLRIRFISLSVDLIAWRQFGRLCAQGETATADLHRHSLQEGLDLVGMAWAQGPPRWAPTMSLAVLMADTISGPATTQGRPVPQHLLPPHSRSSSCDHEFAASLTLPCGGHVMPRAEVKPPVQPPLTWVRRRALLR